MENNNSIPSSINKSTTETNQYIEHKQLAIFQLETLQSKHFIQYWNICCRQNDDENTMARWIMHDELQC